MQTENTRLETPLLGYVVIAVTLILGTITVTAFGQSPHEFARADRQPAMQPIVPRNDLEPVQRRWLLGVQADATAAGYLIRHVEPHSAASSVGLEPGDRIVAIDGLQIGVIGNRVLRLSDTLQRQGGHDGCVRLLVQNRRNGRLVPVKVKLRHPVQHLGHQ